MKRKRIIGFAVIAAMVMLFCLSPLFPYVKSLVVMQVWNQVQKKNSLLEDTIEVKIPGGLSTPETDWYPFVMNFKADEGFSRWFGEAGIRMSILYNFPAFALSKGCSRLYDTESPYYNSFYGAYLVQREGGAPFGFQQDGSMNYEEVGQVPKYDYRMLVLGDFGITSKEFVFEWKVTSDQRDVELAGMTGWHAIEAELTVSGSAHEEREEVMSYLQYGAPQYPYPEGEFAPVAMFGRIYGRYFPEENVSIFFYVVACDEEVCDRCVENILAKSEIISLKK